MIRSILGRATLLQQANAALILLLFAASSLWLTGHTLREDRRSRLDHAAHRLVDVMRLEWSEEGGLLRSARIAIAEGTPAGMTSEVRDSAGALLASSLPPDEREGSRQPPPGNSDPAD